MNSEQEQELMNYLKSLGFSEEAIGPAIHEKQKQNLPAFNVSYNQPYNDDERMLFDLHFVRDFQFNAYRLEKYNAIYRGPVTIQHTSINGINTADLEERMKAIDWNSYFKYPDKIDERESKKINVIMDDLLKLAANDSASGWDIQRRLQYKYWPEEVHDESTKSLGKELEHSRTFTAAENGMCGTTLAYQIQSGNMDELYEKLQLVNTEQFFETDLYIKLDSILSKDTDPFILELSRNDPSGFTELEIPVMKTGGKYTVDNYTAKLTPYPPIEHGVYNGIDTKKLEEQIRNIDWHDDEQLFIFHPDSEPEFLPDVGDIQEQMYRLSQDMVGGDIADQLQLKYWQGATFFEDMIQETAWDHFDELPKRTQKFPLETEARLAFNLLNGRPVMEHLAHPDLSQSDNWIRLNLAAKDGQGNYPVEQISGFGKAALRDLVVSFPIPQPDNYYVTGSLMQGELVSVKLTSDKRVLMSANPEQRTIDVYTPDMRLIPMNIHLDPDWRPPLKEEPSTLQQEQKNKQQNNKFHIIKPVKRRKGKGL